MSDPGFIPRPWQRRIFLAVSALAATAVVLAAREVMLPFVLGLVVAYVLLPAVKWVERRVPRWAAILLVYAVTLGALGGAVALMVPRLVAEGKALAREAPTTTERVKRDYLPTVDAWIEKWTGAPVDVGQEALEAAEAEAAAPRAPIEVETRGDGSLAVHLRKGIVLREVREGVWHLEEQEGRARSITSAGILGAVLDKAGGYVRENSVEVFKLGQRIVAGISRAIFVFFMSLMLGGYMMLTHERILTFFRELWAPTQRDAFDRFLRRLDRGLAGVVRGQLLICLVNGVLSAIGFWLFDLKYWPILAIVAGVMSIIPIFGSILSSIPAVAIGLTQSPGIAFGVLAWIVGIHQVEANFLNPKIIGDAAKIHPVLVVFSLLVGEHFFQITGALFAVPCLSIAQTVFLHFRESTLGLANPLSSLQPGAFRALAVKVPVAPPLPDIRPSSPGEEPPPPSDPKPPVP